MILYIKALKSGLGVLDFYKMLYEDEKYIEHIRNIAYDILVKYGKIATKGNDSIGNKNNMYISVSTENNVLDVDFHWGKNDGEITRFNKKIADMTVGTADLPSVEELVEWVKGKERFFSENPFMLKNNASFFNRDIVGNERDYAERLQVAMEESGTFSFGNKVFRGQSQDANTSNPIKAEYTHKSKKFIDVINEKISKELTDRYNDVSERIVDRVLARNSGSVEYVIAILDDNSVNIINVDTLPEIIVDYIRNNGVIEIEYNDNEDNTIFSDATKKAKAIDSISSSTYNKISRSINNDINSGSKLNVEKYQQILLNTIKRINNK